jgi:hypothetical protein
MYKASTFSKSSLPAWASWDWSQKYLPNEIHIGNDNDCNLVLDSLQETLLVDCNRNIGTLIALGFGLLLRECWRAVEVEPDDESAPIFLQQSSLSKRRVWSTIQAIKKVIGSLPRSDTDEERLEGEKKEKEGKEGSGDKGKTARRGQKKPAVRKHPATPPAVPSTSKMHDAQEEDGSPVKRSQRQRKPSKKVRDHE